MLGHRTRACVYLDKRLRNRLVMGPIQDKLGSSRGAVPAIGDPTGLVRQFLGSVRQADDVGLLSSSLKSLQLLFHLT